MKLLYKGEAVSMVERCPASYKFQYKNNILKTLVQGTVYWLNNNSFFKDLNEALTYIDGLKPYQAQEQVGWLNHD